MRTTIAASLMLLGLIVLSPHARAAESYASCTGVITSLPKTITQPGTWCMKQGLSTASASARAITVASDNVVLDCNDFVLSGTAGGSAKGTGIYAMDRLNVSIRHCKVEGFRTGIYLQSTGVGGGAVVEDNLLDGNYAYGMRVEGDGSVVHRNLVFNSGGSTLQPAAYGIATSGSVDVTDNTVSGVTAAAGSNGSAYGIQTAKNANGNIVGNRVRSLAKDGTGAAYGIYNITSGRITMRSNDVFGDGSPGSVGLYCSDSNSRAKDNIVAGFATGLSRCGDAGDNDVTR